MCSLLRARHQDDMLVKSSDTLLIFSLFIPNLKAAIYMPSISEMFKIKKDYQIMLLMPTQCDTEHCCLANWTRIIIRGIKA